MADEEVHGDVLAVHELVDLVADGLRHDVAVQVRVVDVVEGGASQHHRQLARVVGVVQPVVVLHVPRVEPTREADHAVALLAPHSVRNHRNQVRNVSLGRSTQTLDS